MSIRFTNVKSDTFSLRRHDYPNTLGMWIFHFACIFRIQGVEIPNILPNITVGKTLNLKPQGHCFRKKETEIIDRISKLLHTKAEIKLKARLAKQLQSLTTMPGYSLEMIHSLFRLVRVLTLISPSRVLPVATPTCSSASKKQPWYKQLHIRSSGIEHGF